MDLLLALLSPLVQDHGNIRFLPTTLFKFLQIVGPEAAGGGINFTAFPNDTMGFHSGSYGLDRTYID